MPVCRCYTHMFQTSDRNLRVIMVELFHSQPGKGTKGPHNKKLFTPFFYRRNWHLVELLCCMAHEIITSFINATLIAISARRGLSLFIDLTCSGAGCSLRGEICLHCRTTRTKNVLMSIPKVELKILSYAISIRDYLGNGQHFQLDCFNSMITVPRRLRNAFDATSDLVNLSWKRVSCQDEVTSHFHSTFGITRLC